jgi:uncharacterized protein
MNAVALVLSLGLAVACAAPRAAAPPPGPAAAPAAPPAAAAVTHDPPPDPDHPPLMRPAQIPSGEVAMNGVFYLAAGTGPHPTVLLLHGFPGNERNFDLAQAIRRAGWNVLTLHYRGSWGSPGAFSFAAAIEDTGAALAFLRDPAVAASHRVDPATLVVIGHSMGGFMAATVAASDPALAGVALLAAWNLGRDGAAWRAADADARAAAIERLRPNTIPLAGCTAEGLFDELVARGAGWDFVTYAPRLTGLPSLIVSADDAFTAESAALVAALERAGAPVTAHHLAADHAFSAHRIALQTRVLAWLAAVPRR